ncbi:hypothetical protein QR98_0072170 [Sarcoptes scabiei]|uniref:Uncharacterized protein n=1 Tax=Sarcoptes scabiei TaxID=52283 RepID=A0A132ACP7_SARSC|nr:hypothetical protein QR98_0072170 [Sarcoptes scabiei]
MKILKSCVFARNDYRRDMEIFLSFCSKRHHHHHTRFIPLPGKKVLFCYCSALFEALEPIEVLKKQKPKII